MATKRTRSPKVAGPDLNISAEIAWYLKTRGIPLPDCPPRWKTPEPSWVPGAVFDPGAVDRVMQAFQQIRHTQGKWAGLPLKPDPWQVAYIIAPVFGWKHPDDDGRLVRIIRKLYVEVSRKNGKSTLLGGLGLYLTGGDGEQGAQVIAAATTRDQAGFVFNPIKELVTKSAALKQHFRHVGFKVLHARTGSYLQVISNVADAQHGANIHGGLIDELHVHKTPTMVEVIESGTGSRSQPLIAIITTADENKTNSIYDQRRGKIEQLAKGLIKEPAQYGVIWCAEVDDDPFDEATWRKANPGYGISPTKAYMRAAAESARNTPTELPKFQRLHLGVRISELVKWLPLDKYDATGQLIDDVEWQGMRCHGGLDLSTTSDLTAFVLRGRDAERGHPFRALHWLPEERIRPLEKLTSQPLARWVREGWIKTTEGNVVDHEQVAADIIADLETLGVECATIAFDPWNSSTVVRRLEDAGYQVVPVRQGYATLSAPSKSIERLVVGSTPEHPLMRTGGNPVMRWMADCVEIRTDDNGNIKPVKPDRVKSAKRIDGWVAAIMAEREDMAEIEDVEPAGDVYLKSLIATASASATEAG